MRSWLALPQRQLALTVFVSVDIVVNHRVSFFLGVGYTDYTVDDPLEVASV